MSKPPEPTDLAAFTAPKGAAPAGILGKFDFGSKTDRSHLARWLRRHDVDDAVVRAAVHGENMAPQQVEQLRALVGEVVRDNHAASLERQSCTDAPDEWVQSEKPPAATIGEQAHPLKVFTSTESFPVAGRGQVWVVTSPAGEAPPVAGEAVVLNGATVAVMGVESRALPASVLTSREARLGILVDPLTLGALLEMLDRMPPGPAGEWGRDALRAEWVNIGPPADRCAELGIAWDADCQAAYDVGIMQASEVVRSHGAGLGGLSAASPKLSLPEVAQGLWKLGMDIQ